MSGQFLSPRVLQIAGLVIILASGVYWGLTQHQSALFVGAGVTLCTLGVVNGRLISIRQEFYDGKHKQVTERASEDREQ